MAYLGNHYSVLQNRSMNRGSRLSMNLAGSALIEVNQERAMQIKGARGDGRLTERKRDRHDGGGHGD
jgi:hypothetical protein